MERCVPRALALLFVLSCSSSVASATSIDIGILSFDADVIETGSLRFDITNGTGANASLLGFDITTPVAITVTGLTANKSGGGTLILNGSDFTVVDAAGDVNCTASGDAGSGGCNFAAYTLSSAVLTGTLGPTTGLVGLPPGFIGIANTFTAALNPLSALSAGDILNAGDFVNVQATLVAAGPATPVPEPSTGILLNIGVIGLFAAYKLKQRSVRGSHETA